VFSLTLLKSPTSADLLKEYRYILLEKVLDELKLMGDTLIKGKYLDRKAYIRIQNKIDKNKPPLNLKVAKNPYDAGYRITSGKFQTDDNVKVIQDKEGKKEVSNLSEKQWKKIILVSMIQDKKRSSDLYGFNEKLEITPVATKEQLISKLNKRNLSTVGGIKALTQRIFNNDVDKLDITFDENKFPASQNDVNEEVANKLFPKDSKVPYAGKKYIMYDKTDGDHEWLSGKISERYIKALTDAEKSKKRKLEVKEKEKIQRELLNKWGEGRENKWKVPSQKDLKNRIIEAIRQELGESNISDTVLFNDYQSDVKPEDTRPQQKKEREERRAKYEEEQGKLTEAARQKKDKEWEARPQIERDLLEILSRSKNLPVYSAIQEALTTHKTKPQQIEIITDIIEEVKGDDKTSPYITTASKDLPILERVLEKLKEETEPKFKRVKTSTRRIDNTKIKSDVIGVMENTRIGDDKEIYIGKPLTKRTPLKLSESAWEEFKNTRELASKGRPMNAQFLKKGKFQRIGEYYLRLVGSDILELEGEWTGFNDKSNDEATRAYASLQSGSETDNLDSTRLVEINKALSRIRPSPIFPNPNSLSFSLFYKNYIKAYPNNNPDELSVYIQTLINEVNSRLKSGGKLTEEGEYMKEAKNFMDFTIGSPEERQRNELSPLDKVIKIIKEGIGVDNETGEITHNFVAAYKAQVELFSSPNTLIRHIIDVSDGHIVSSSLKGIDKKELENIEKEMSKKLTQRVPEGDPNAKSILNYLLKAHAEAYNAHFLQNFFTDKKTSGEKEESLSLVQQKKLSRKLGAEQREQAELEAASKEEALNEQARKEGYSSHKDKIKTEEEAYKKQLKELRAKEKIRQTKIPYAGEKLRASDEKAREKLKGKTITETVEVKNPDGSTKMKTVVRGLTEEGEKIERKVPVTEQKTRELTEEEIDYIVTGKKLNNIDRDNRTKQLTNWVPEKYRINKSDIIKTDKGLILESINSKEKKKIKTLLQHANPTDFFGQDFLKLGELLDVLKELGVVKGNIKLNKKVIAYDDKNLKVVKLASRLRKLYEGLYRDLREIVYPNKGGKLR